MIVLRGWHTCFQFLIQSLQTLIAASTVGLTEILCCCLLFRTDVIDPGSLCFIHGSRIQHFPLCIKQGISINHSGYCIGIIRVHDADKAVGIICRRYHMIQQFADPAYIGVLNSHYRLCIAIKKIVAIDVDMAQGTIDIPHGSGSKINPCDLRYILIIFFHTVIRCWHTVLPFPGIYPAACGLFFYLSLFYHRFGDKK